MTNKSGGDIFQGNQGMQGNVSMQDLNSVAAAGAGVQDAFGGEAFSTAFGNQNVNQNQNQSNSAASGSGGGDNIHSDTNVNA